MPVTELDRLLHAPLRLAIVTALAEAPSLTFGDLKRIVGATDGNLSIHARKLEQAGYVSCRKRFAGRVPRTDYRLSEKGTKALGRYLDRMEALIQAARRR